MTKNQSLIFRCVLFIAGAGIVVLAFFLTRGGRELNRIDAFVWTSISLMYIILFLPFFLFAVSTRNFSGKIPVLSLIWLGIALYLAASVAVIILLSRAGAISFNTAVIIQSVLLLLFLIDVYFAYFARSHVGAVAAEEKGKQMFVSEMKSKAQVFQLSLDKLPAEYENTQKILKRALDDIKYIYPVDGGVGEDLELEILGSLRKLTELVGNIQSGAHTTALKSEAEILQSLVNERKLLRN